MTLEARAFATELGEIWLWGRPADFAGTGPVVFGVGGAFDREATCLAPILERLPPGAMLTANLPGDHCPPLAMNAVATYALAFDQVLETLGRPVMLCGASTGALVALAMRSPLIQAALLLEPPLRTAKLWPLIAQLQAEYEADPSPATRDFITNVFGVTGARVEDRDYTHLLAALRWPVLCLVGDDPLLPQRAVPLIPSLVDDPEREILAATPGLQLRVVPNVGHDLPGRVEPLIVKILADGLGRLGA